MSVWNLTVAPLSGSEKLYKTSLTVVLVINNKSFVGTRVCSLIALTPALSSTGTLSRPFSTTSIIIPNLFVIIPAAALSATLAVLKYCVVAVCMDVYPAFEYPGVGAALGPVWVILLRIVIVSAILEVHPASPLFAFVVCVVTTGTC